MSRRSPAACRQAFMKACQANAMKRLLWLVLLLSLIPGLLLAYNRFQAEGTSRTVTLLMDEIALRDQAAIAGVSIFELAERYRALGLNGIALYEDTLESLEAKGRVAKLSNAEAKATAALLGESLPELPANSTLVTELTPGGAAGLLAKNTPEPQRVTLAGREWLIFAGDARLRPAGPDLTALAVWQAAGWDIAYRPRNFPQLSAVGADFPGVSYIIHAGTEIAGHPNLIDELVAASQGFLTGIIESTPQDGQSKLVNRVPTTRVFSISQEWLDTMRPEDAVPRFVLAANERGARLLYLRPYSRERMGDMFENTEALIGGLAAALKAEGFTIGPVRPLVYEPNQLLRLLSAVGVLAGLLLLATLYPGAWGPLVALGLSGLAVAAAGLSWDALALLAALIFPVIGYALLPERLTSFGVATLISLLGAVLLAAVGTDGESILAARPFAGVAATLIVPPLLFLFQYALRYGRPVDWVAAFWRYPIRIGDVLLGLMVLAALALVLLRRGNFPVIGVSELELTVRSWLAELFVRPRFKELIGHPLAVVALGSAALPAWVKALLLTGGVIAQASILNSFSHYHTPLLISLARTLIALVIGLVIGLLLLPLTRWLLAAGRRWLASAKPMKPA